MIYLNKTIITAVVMRQDLVWLSFHISVLQLKSEGIVLLGMVISSSIFTAPEVNLYSVGKEALIKPFLDRFTQETGVEVNLVMDKADASFTKAIQ